MIKKFTDTDFWPNARIEKFMDGLDETGIKEYLMECKIDKLAKVVTLKQQMMINDYLCFF